MAMLKHNGGVALPSTVGDGNNGDAIFSLLKNNGMHTKKKLNFHTTKSLPQRNAQNAYLSI